MRVSTLLLVFTSILAAVDQYGATGLFCGLNGTNKFHRDEVDETLERYHAFVGYETRGQMIVDTKEGRRFSIRQLLNCLNQHMVSDGSSWAMVPKYSPSLKLEQRRVHSQILTHSDRQGSCIFATSLLVGQGTRS